MTSLNSTKREIRKFGLIAMLLFGGLSALAVWRQKYGLICFFGVLTLLGFCFLSLPGLFGPIYRGWLKTAHWIGTFFTLLILAMAYYLVITPSAWMKKIFGGSPLPLKPNPDIESYWVARKDPAQPKERFYLRY